MAKKERQAAQAPPPPPASPVQTDETLELSALERIEALERKLKDKDAEIAQLEDVIGSLELEKETLLKAEPDRELWYRANYDGLTGLRRKEGYVDESEKLLRRMLKERMRYMKSYEQQRKSDLERPREPDTFSVIVIDLDDFKFINDTYGHSIGDRVLQMASQVVRNAVREDEDIIGRFGGEELTISLKNQPGKRQVIAERIRKEIEQLVVTAKDSEGRPVKVPVTASVGVAKWEEGETFQEVFDHADEAMYKAKGAGKNRIWLYEGIPGVDEPLLTPGARDVRPPEVIEEEKRKKETAEHENVKQHEE